MPDRANVLAFNDKHLKVMAIGGQMIVTALSKDFRLFGQPEAVFHVEQGAVEKVY